MVLPSNSFETRFLRLCELSEAGNSNLEAYARAADPSKTDEKDRLNAILMDKENVVVAVNKNKEIIFLHSIVNLGGTFIKPENKIVCLQGMGSDSPAFILDAKTACEEIEFEFPNLKKISESQTIEELSNLRPLKTNKFTCTQLFFPTPYELKALILADSRDPMSLLTTLKDAAKQEDNNTMGEVEIMNSDKFSKHTSRNLIWLWAVTNGIIPEVKMVVDVEDPELNEFKTKRMGECILPPMPSLGRNNTDETTNGGFNQLSSALVSFGESINRSNAVRSLELKRMYDKDEEKGDRVRAVMDISTKNMILNAMSVDGERPAEELTEDFRRFFNAKTAGAAGLETLNQLRTSGFMNSTISEGAINNMYHGNLVSLLGTVISGFCPFTFKAAKIMQESQQKSFMIMHQQDSFGGNKTAEDIEKSMKQNIIMPKDYHDMMGMFKRQNAMMKKWLGPEAELTIEHIDFIVGLERSECSIEAKVEEDKDYCTKIMYGGALAEQVFWRQCYECEDRETVAKPNFKRVLELVEIGQFNCELPAQFKRIEKRKADETSDNSLLNEIKRLKSELGRRNSSNNSERTDNRIFNGNQFPDFKIRQNEDWRKVFCSKQKHGRLPQIDGVQMCPKWNVQGYCFADCKRVKTHLPHADIPDNKKKEFAAWISSCRAGNGSM